MVNSIYRSIIILIFAISLNFTTTHAKALVWRDVSALNSNANSDSGGDNYPVNDRTACSKRVTVWSSSDSLGDTIGTDRDILFSLSSDNGSSWSAPTALNTNAATDSGDDFSPSIGSDCSGNLVVVWLSTDTLNNTIGTDNDILVSRSSDGGENWTAPAILNTNATTDSGGDYNPYIVRESYGGWLVIWDSTDSLDSTIGTDSDILLSRSSDHGASWSAPVALNNNASSDSGYDYNPKISGDGAGNWVAVWNANGALGGHVGSTDEDIFVSRSVDNATSWSTPVALNSNADSESGFDFEPDIANDGMGNWVVVWHSDDFPGATSAWDFDILFSRSTDNGGNWTTPDTLNTNASTDSGSDTKASISTDRMGNWVTVWESNDSLDGTIGTDNDILVSHSSDNGVSWSPPTALNSNASSDSGWDSSAKIVEGYVGYFLVVWTSDDTLDDTIGSDTDIFMSRTINILYAPYIYNVTPGNQSASIAFSAPYNSGGSSITSYTASCGAGTPATGTTSPLIVTGLTNGNSYNCSVIATNAAGNSPASSTVSVTPRTVAGAPTIGTGTPGNMQASIAFSFPDDNGGSSITSYTASCGAGTPATGTTSPLTVTGLTNGNSYNCSVIATNAAGNSPASSTVSVTPRTVPGAPTIGTGTPGNMQASIAFSFPDDNGGSSITSYTASCGAGTPATGTTSPLIVTGLTNGNSYNCSVIATNAAGNSPASNIVSVIPQNTDVCATTAETYNNDTYTGNVTVKSQVSISSAMVISSGIDVTYEAPVINLSEGFHAQQGSIFTARASTVSCPSGDSVSPKDKGLIHSVAEKNNLKANATINVSKSPVKAAQWLSYNELPVKLKALLSLHNAKANEFQSNASGDQIVFSSETDLLDNDSNQLSDIYLYHSMDDRLILVSRTAADEDSHSGNGESTHGRINGKGSYIVYRSEASNLIGHHNDSNQVADIYLYFIPDGIQGRISYSHDGNQSSNPSNNPAIAGDAPYLVYDRQENSQQQVFSVDITDDTLQSVQLSESINPKGKLIDNSQPKISSNGRYVIYLSHAHEDNHCSLHILDRETQQLDITDCPGQIIENPLKWQLLLDVNGFDNWINE